MNNKSYTNSYSDLNKYELQNKYYIKSLNKQVVLKRISLFILLILISFISFETSGLSTNNYKYNNKYVALGGETIGLELNTGVYITGKFKVKTKDGYVEPWKESNVEINDIIEKINDQPIDSIDDIKEIVNSNINYRLQIKRNINGNDTTIYTSIVPVNNIINPNNHNYDNCDNYSLGLYVKDSILGVGTLTYYDIKTGKYAALGHNACNNMISGNIRTSYVNGITKGIRGIPGEKKASVGSEILGNITLNNEIGIFGKLNNINKNNELIMIGNASDVHNGKATITTVINGRNKETFEIEIINVEKQEQEDIKGIKFEVVDKELLEKTGGIIQGMSGSPIVQDGKLIGAVSHVVIDDSRIGYGVFSEFMAKYS